MSRSASKTPRLLAVSRFRGFRGLAGGDWARISATVRSADSGSGEVSAGRWDVRWGEPGPSIFFLLMLPLYPYRTTEDALDAHAPGG